VKLSELLRIRREWECPNGCGDPYRVHQLHGGYDLITREGTLSCAPPPEPKDCCGRLPGDETEEIRACSKGACRAWWCVCGTFSGMSDGPVMCGCEYDRGEVSTDPPENLQNS
jgi:hypothetical protein